MAVNKFELGQHVIIPEGVEINHGLSEDSDSFVLLTPLEAVIVRFCPGAVEVTIPGHEDLSPAYWHQPEPKE